jgi:PAS domain S-box-containing protein
VWEDGECAFCRGWRQGADGAREPVLVVRPRNAHPGPAVIDRLAHEYALARALEGAAAVQPLELIHEHGRTLLVLEDPGGEPLERAPVPLELRSFLRLAIGIGASVGTLHARGLVHKDIKPAHILVNRTSGAVRLTGFGIASPLPRECQAPEPPEFIAGTLAYMAPEQTGRMNRSVDSRSDLYSLGVTLYQLLTGVLPFNAADPMEWVHCHIARQPVPAAERAPAIPAPISTIVMKLLAKTPEDRYQTASGVEHDLRRCLAQWETEGRIDAFAPGEHDTPDRLMIPEKLYGRERELATLLAAFERVVAGGKAELVLVAGYSGIGKSAVVNELHKVLVPPRGLFASGKFDQYKRDIPYATLAQAFQSLVRSLLSKSEAELAIWRNDFREALGPNGLLMVDLVPELKLVIGEQPPVPVLPSQDAQRRFQRVFLRFIGVFARPEHPLALFLDDLQWLDVATLDLLEALLSQPDARHLMLIGAYRNNEVSATHPLTRKLEAIREAGAVVQEIVLAPLGCEHLEQFVADALHCGTLRAAPLARLIHEKTTGNPFFVIQFVAALAEEGLLTFDHEASQWSWDLDRIHAKGYTDNVVDLMIDKLSRLPEETQTVLQQLACIGNRSEFALLRMIYQDSKEALHDRLWPAVQTGLVFRSENAYQFLHDRVQEAAYSMIPAGLRAEVHLRIGRLLAANTPLEQREGAIFEIVNQLNHAAHLITSADERERVAELNLLAGRRAKVSTAYASALIYLAAGRALLTEENGEHAAGLIFSFEYLMAECELLTADMPAAEQRLSMLTQRARSSHDIAMVTRLRLTLYTTLDQSSRSVELCLQYLQRGGTQWAPHPSRDEIRREYERIWTLLGSRPIEALLDLPVMTDPDMLDTLDVLTEIVPPAFFTDPNLCALVVCRMVNLSLEYGNSDGSCYAYVWLATYAGPQFGHYQAGFRFGRLGYDLVEQRGLTRYKARTYSAFGNIVMPWERHILDSRELIRRSFDVANESGDLTYAVYGCCDLIQNYLAVGDPLADVQRELEKGLAFVRKARFGLVVDIMTAQFALVRTLRGATLKFGSFNDAQFDEVRFERHVSSDPALARPAFLYWTRKLQACYFAGNYANAQHAAVTAQQLLWIAPSQFETAEFHFYGALAHGACWDSAEPRQRQTHLDALTAHHRQFQIWAEHCPENFENRAALVGAEIARIEGRDVEAMRLYEQAIRSARENSFVHNEALAYELAARFYAARGFEQIARLYLRSARYGYLRWGADAKVQQLDESFAQFRDEAPESSPTATIGTPVDHLDLATVIKVSQAVAGEFVLENLLDTLLRAALEQAGASRGLLIMSRDDALQADAEAVTRGDTVVVRAGKGAALPESVVQYVARTRESVILDDASAQNPFSTDPYVREHHARSILCLPLVNQTQLVGVLYLENNLAPHVFTTTRIAVLKVLASQAAISLENSRLYLELAEREANIRRLVEASIIGVFIWDLTGQIYEANDAFLRIVGYDRADLSSGRIRWTDLTPADWRDRDTAALAELQAKGDVQPYEKEYLRADGSRAAVLIGAAALGGPHGRGVAFIIDLTERKRAESEARESDRRYRTIELELAHANRVATMGQLTASITHEIRQPIAAAVTNAQAAIRWLGAPTPALDEVRQALVRIIDDATRANDVIGRIRALVTKAPARRELVAINDAIREVVALTHAEAAKHGVAVNVLLDEGLPLVHGDRVQLQQVMLNLMINAVEAMAGVGEGTRELSITTRVTGARAALVAVGDSGPGVDVRDLERLFEPFYTTKADGMGMGLSICRSIVEAHGGRLWASVNVPCGAVFQFVLPGGEADEAGAAADGDRMRRA